MKLLRISSVIVLCGTVTGSAYAGCPETLSATAEYGTLLEQTQANLQKEIAILRAPVSVPIRIDPTGSTTQPVSGTVTVIQGTAGSSPWPVGVADGATFTRSTSTAATIGCVYETSDPSLTAGRSYGVRCGSLGDLAVIVREAGKTIRRVKSAAGVNQDATQIGSGAKILYYVFCWNKNSSTAAWANIYDVAAPTSGSTPIDQIYVPVSGGNNRIFGVDGAAFSTALSVRYVTASMDSSAAAVASEDVACSFGTDS